MITRTVSEIICYVTGVVAGAFVAGRDELQGETSCQSEEGNADHCRHSLQNDVSSVCQPLAPSLEACDVNHAYCKDLFFFFRFVGTAVLILVFT